MENASFVTAVDTPDISALRSIFDAFDGARTGRIRFDDVASQWQIAKQLNADGSQQRNAPAELIVSLREVSRGGYLTFDMFLDGVRLALDRARRNDQLRLARPVSQVNAGKPNGYQNGTNVNSYNANPNNAAAVAHVRPRMIPVQQPQPIFNGAPPMQRVSTPSSRTMNPNSNPNVPRNGFTAPPWTAPPQMVPPMNSAFWNPAPPVSNFPQDNPALPNGGNRQRRSDLPRRHTLNGNAIDMTTVRCLAMLDDECALLRDGVTLSDRVAAHLRLRLAENERMREACESGGPNVDLSVLSARVADANRRVNALRSALETARQAEQKSGALENSFEQDEERALGRRRRFGSNWNLSSTPSRADAESAEIGQLLRTQNGLLMREVSDLRAQLARVDSEKSALFRVLLEPKQRSSAVGDPAAMNLVTAASNHNLNSNAIAFLQAQRLDAEIETAANNGVQQLVSEYAFV